ncbi:accessory gene regulator ArgB-like protein [Mahella australiensis]|uniref:Accessory gene regulator B n=1 Tax=Mahella australiensis (strain DSM 15567 / CIP 107919 / 50-1 BON) TaxID=697281 RepID=F3ZYW4_MAHA5|nr:accessory gene regulator B family protein [Mahella australiensis]AEE95709.1 Accessory gene regulator B [Mahella australiensis 50-1 BON]
MNVDDTAKRISYSFQKNLRLDEPSRQVIQYSLTMALAAALSAGLTAITGWLVGAFWPTIVAASSSAWLRNFSGGAHCSSAGRCAVAGAVSAPLLGLTALYGAKIMGNWNYALIALITIISLYIMFKYAPDEAPEKPIPARRKPVLHKRSMLWVMALGASSLLMTAHMPWLGVSIALGMLWQCFTLLPAGHGFVSSVDNLLSRWINI